VVLNDKQDIIDTFYDECCPWYPKSFDEETVQFHGMSLSYLKRQQSSYNMCIKILHFLNKYRDENKIVYRPFIYHALNRFDFLFMENLFLKNGLEFSFRKIFHRQHSFSTIKMAREFGYNDNGLDVWANRLGDRFEHHNALSDAKQAARVFQHLTWKGASLESGFEIKKSEMLDDVDDEVKQKNRRVYKNKNYNEVTSAITLC
jgi:DNA polymerase III epsilon subunit-like protein